MTRGDRYSRYRQLPEDDNNISSTRVKDIAIWFMYEGGGRAGRFATRRTGGYFFLGGGAGAPLYGRHADNDGPRRTPAANPLRISDDNVFTIESRAAVLGYINTGHPG